MAHEVAELHATIHELVCEHGRMPIEVKSADVVERIGRAILAIDLDDVRALQHEVDALKREINGYERELQKIREGRRVPAVPAA